jgi:hypothetical protein
MPLIPIKQIAGLLSKLDNIVTKAVPGEGISIDSDGNSSGTGNITFSLSAEKINEIAQKVDEENEKGLYSEAFMIYQTLIKTRSQTSFVNLINNTWH